MNGSGESRQAGRQARRQGGSLLSSTLRNLDTQVSGGGCRTAIIIASTVFPAASEKTFPARRENF